MENHRAGWMISLAGCALLMVFASCYRTPSAATDATRIQDHGEAEIRQWLDRFAKAFGARDVNAIMALYAPDLVAYDIVPPLQYVGRDSYRKNYEEFLAQYKGPLDIEYRDLHIFAGGDIAFAATLERISGTLLNGEKSTVWVRVTSGFRKIDETWFDIHDHVSVPTDFATGKSKLDLTH
jgi:uncharacterized protein (TIGR02246 family)